MESQASKTLHHSLLSPCTTETALERDFNLISNMKHCIPTFPSHLWADELFASNNNVNIWRFFIIINKKFLEFFMWFSSCVFLLRASYPYRTTSVGGTKWSQCNELAGLWIPAESPSALRSSTTASMQCRTWDKTAMSATSHYFSFPRMVKLLLIPHVYLPVWPLRHCAVVA